MTYRQPFLSDFGGDKVAFGVYRDSYGCDDELPAAWTPCVTGNGHRCRFYGTINCPHGIGFTTAPTETIS